MKESDVLNTWLWDKHRTDIQWRRVRLGVLPTKQLARIYMTMLRWADAIVLDHGAVLIIEAKLRPQPGAIGQLLLYEQLFKVTPEFSAYSHWPIRKMLLTTLADINLIQLASNENIEYEIFTVEDVNRTRYDQALTPV